MGVPEFFLHMTACPLASNDIGQAFKLVNVLNHCDFAPLLRRRFPKAEMSLRSKMIVKLRAVLRCMNVVKHFDKFIEREALATQMSVLGFKCNELRNHPVAVPCIRVEVVLIARYLTLEGAEARGTQKCK